MKVPLALLALASLLAACSSVHTHRTPGVNLERYQRFYVEHRLTDDHHLDEMIVARLQALGRQASAGPLTMMPQDTQAIVTYQDEWAWDFKSYLIQLNLQIRDAHRGRPLAYGIYRQPSPVPKPPVELVQAILDPLFAPQ